MGLTGPYPHLVKRRPLGTLAGLRVYISILSQYVLMCGIQLAVFFYLRTQNWYYLIVTSCSLFCVFAQVHTFKI